MSDLADRQLQGTVDVGEELSGAWRVGPRQQSAVDDTGVHVELDWHSGASQPRRVVDVLVQEWVHLANADEGGRQPDEVLGASGRRGVGYPVAFEITEIGPPADPRVWSSAIASRSGSIEPHAVVQVVPSWRSGHGPRRAHGVAVRWPTSGP